jgi:hypothetical protein
MVKEQLYTFTSELQKATEGKATLARIIKGAPINGMDVEQLGVPLDDNFNPLINNTENLFPLRGAPIKQTNSHIYYDSDLIDSEEELAVNLHGWGVGGGVKAQFNQRYAYYRAIQESETLTLRDNTPMLLNLPEGAKYYLYKIIRGHSFEAVISGDEKSFNTNVGKEIMVAGVNLEGYAKKNNLHINLKAHGLTPKSGKAIFAKTMEDISNNYTADGPTEVLLLEYRVIPGRKLNDNKIIWRRARTVMVKLTTLHAKNNGTLMLDSKWKINIYCGVNGAIDYKDNSMEFSRDDIESNHDYNLSIQRYYDLFEGDTFSCVSIGDHQAKGWGIKDFDKGVMSVVYQMKKYPKEQVRGVISGNDHMYKIDFSINESVQTAR